MHNLTFICQVFSEKMFEKHDDHIHERVYKAPGQGQTTPEGQCFSKVQFFC